jgi:hypothetical protein
MQFALLFKTLRLFKQWHTFRYLGQYKYLLSALINTNFYNQPTILCLEIIRAMKFTAKPFIIIKNVQKILQYFRFSNMESIQFRVVGKLIRQKRMRASVFKYMSQRYRHEYGSEMTSTYMVAKAKTGIFGIHLGFIFNCGPKIYVHKKI